MNNSHHIMTCDLEDWYHPSLINIPMDQWGSYESRIEKTTERILNLFQETNTQATFFVLGDIAERFPKTIEKIIKNGHEIACHSYSHRLIYNMTPHEFEKDTRKAVSILKDITGANPKGYRSPSWSTTLHLDWFWEILKENGFEYDSSLYPYKTFLYGDNSNPRTPYKIEKYGLFEMPPSVGEIFGKRVPYSGGFFLRILPLFFINTFIRQYEKMKAPAILYFHPWELDTEIPKQNLGLKNSFITYANIGGFQGKIQKLAQEYYFTSIEKFLMNYKGKEKNAVKK